MLGNKQKVFDDFSAAATELVRLGWTRSERLAIQGESNGGLLVGAMITQHPEQFRVAVCRVPLADMIRYPLVGIGSSWVPEYGNPGDPAHFANLLAYSPYHHVKPGVRYPAVLVTTADSDDRVDPMHARKFAAALQASSLGGPTLLTVQQHAGHLRSATVSAWVQNEADALAFIASQLN
jgi:prolyl oligopeptidase